MSIARGAAWRVGGSTVPYQFNKYNLPMFHRKTGERNLPGLSNATIMKQMDTELALWRWRRRVRNMQPMRKATTQGKKHLYNVEFVGFLKARLNEYLSHKTLILQEEQAMLAYKYGNRNVANVLTIPEKQRERMANLQGVDTFREHKTRPAMANQIKHRPERDVPVSYLKPQGQHAYQLSFFAGKGTATQLSD